MNCMLPLDSRLAIHVARFGVARECKSSFQFQEGFPLSVALVRTLSTWNNQSQPVNPSGVISAIGTNDAIYNNDVGSPWVWTDITVGVVPTNNAYWNGTLVATDVAHYTNWILDNAR